MQINTTQEIYSMICHHQTQDGGNKFVLVDCSLQPGVQHKISQWGDGYICNNCCELIKKACNLTINNKTECMQCKGSEHLQNFVNSKQICQHENATINKVKLQCIMSQVAIYHELDLGDKSICSECEKKLIFKYEAQQQCKICSNKTKQLLTNLKGSLANQEIRVIKKLLLILAQRKASNFFKKEIENHCIRRQTKQKIEKHKSECKIKDLTEFVTEMESLNHKDSKYLYYSKCQKHKNQSLKVCSTCITVLLNINLCPFGCDIKSISLNLKQTKGKTSHETGFIILSPIPNIKKKEGLSSNYYLQMISLQNIIVKTKFDQMEIQQKEIYQDTKQSQITPLQYPVFGGVCAISSSKYILAGGILNNGKDDILTNNVWLFEIYKDKNEYFFKSIKLASLNVQRASHSLIYFNEEVYAIGGYNSSGYLSKCQKYSFKQNKWIQIASLNLPRSKPTVFVKRDVKNQKNSQLIVLGGISNQPQILSYGEFLTPDAKTWINIIEQTDKFDQYSPMTGMIATSRVESLSKYQNILLFGGSNYNDYTQGTYDFVLKDNKSFSLIQKSLKLESKRAFSQIAVLDTNEKNQKKIILFGGGLQHENILNIEVILCEIKDQTISPIFATQLNETYYPEILKYEKSNHYKFIIKNLQDRGIRIKDKLKSGKQNQFSNNHLLQTLWLWGKPIINFIPEKEK